MISTRTYDTHIATASAMLTYASLQLDYLFTVPNLFLSSGMLLLMIVEVGTRFGLSRKQMEERDTSDYSFAENARGKAMMLSLVIVALVFDWVAVTTGFFASSTVSVHYITRGAIVYIIAHQAAQIMRNVWNHEGDGAVPPILIWFVRRLREIDKEQYGSKKLPHRRPYDDEEVVKEIAEELKNDKPDKN
jgi:phage-related holin